MPKFFSSREGYGGPHHSNARNANAFKILSAGGDRAEAGSGRFPPPWASPKRPTGRNPTGGRALRSIDPSCGAANGHHRGIPETRRRMPPHGARHAGFRDQGHMEPHGGALAELARDRTGAHAAALGSPRAPAPRGAWVGRGVARGIDLSLRGAAPRRRSNPGRHVKPLDCYGTTCLAMTNNYDSNEIFGIF